MRSTNGCWPTASGTGWTKGKHAQSEWLGAGRCGCLGSAVGRSTGSLKSQSPIIPGVYTCTDAKGRKLTADRPIPECTDREQKVLNPSGTVKAKIGPTLTAQERADQDLKEKRELEERNKTLPMSAAETVHCSPVTPTKRCTMASGAMHWRKLTS